MGRWPPTSGMGARWTSRSTMAAASGWLAPSARTLTCRLPSAVFAAGGGVMKSPPSHHVSGNEAFVRQQRVIIARRRTVTALRPPPPSARTSRGRSAGCSSRTCSSGQASLSLLWIPGRDTTTPYTVVRCTPYTTYPPNRRVGLEGRGFELHIGGGGLLLMGIFFLAMIFKLGNVLLRRGWLPTIPNESHAPDT